MISFKQQQKNGNDSVLSENRKEDTKSRSAVLMTFSSLVAYNFSLIVRVIISSDLKNVINCWGWAKYFPTFSPAKRDVLLDIETKARVFHKETAFYKLT